MRKSGLNIMMSMKTEQKPVSFVEDCAVKLENLADYTNDLKKYLKNMMSKELGMPMLQ